MGNITYCTPNRLKNQRNTQTTYKGETQDTELIIIYISNVHAWAIFY